MQNHDLKTLVYEVIREKLINCEYAPGVLLNETQLTEELGVSRTPIREALTRISHEGFIRIIPKKGIYVKDVTVHDVMQIFQARLELEPIALRLACHTLPEEYLHIYRSKFEGEEPDVRNAYRVDTAMHLFIIEHCGNRFIIDTLRKVFDENTRVIISSKQNEVNIHDARNEHLEILDLLIEKKNEKAEHAMRTHIESCKRAAMDYFYNYKPYVMPYDNLLGEKEKIEAHKLLNDIKKKRKKG